MDKRLGVLTVLGSTLAMAPVARAQSVDAPPTGSQAAPIVRAYETNPAPQTSGAPQANGAPQPNAGEADLLPQPAYDGRMRAPIGIRGRMDGGMRETNQLVDSQPIVGVWLRSNSQSVMRTISATPHGTEIRVERGVLNVSVHQPMDHAEILVDLPGGQVSLVKDGLYTFNADTNTVRVLRGEAAAFPGSFMRAGGPVAAQGPVAGVEEKPIKVKGDHQLSFGRHGEQVKPVESYAYELTADLLPMGNGEVRGYASYSGDDGPYPYNPWVWGYPYAWSPYGYGYGYGIGIGYYGGFHGGYRGGFRR